jgi:two-component system, cell cycle response regulator
MHPRMPEARILVVEDDAEIRQLIGAVLGTQGHTVFEAHDGLAALPAAQEHEPEVVLLDLGLPGLDGFGVLEQLKADPALRDVPVLMVTAWAETELVAKALRLGAFDYVRKPFDIAELVARVDAALRAVARREAGRGPDGIPTVDQLTGLANRYRLTAELERLIAAGRRDETPLSLVLLSLDGYAELVAGHGAETADAVLRAAADRIAGKLGPDELVGRWSDQDFLVLADGAGAEAAAALAEKLGAAIGEQPFATPLATLAVTVSAGIATWEGETLERLLGRVDTALYAARDAGAGLTRAA